MSCHQSCTVLCAHCVSKPKVSTKHCAVIFSCITVGCNAFGITNSIFVCVVLFLSFHVKQHVILHTTLLCIIEHAWNQCSCCHFCCTTCLCVVSFQCCCSFFLFLLLLLFTFPFLVALLLSHTRHGQCCITCCASHMVSPFHFTQTNDVPSPP